MMIIYQANKMQYRCLYLLLYHEFYRSVTIRGSSKQVVLRANLRVPLWGRHGWLIASRVLWIPPSLKPAIHFYYLFSFNCNNIEEPSYLIIVKSSHLEHNRKWKYFRMNTCFSLFPYPHCYQFSINSNYYWLNSRI